MKKLMILTAALLLTAPLLAHHDGDEAKEAAQDAGHQVQAAGSALAKDAQALGQAAGQAATQAVDQAKNQVVEQAQPLVLLREGATQHMHNKIVHFTLALGVVGALFYLMSLWKPEYLKSTRILLALSCAAGALSIPTGEAQGREFETGRLHATLEMHETLGKVSLALFVALLVLSFLPSTRKWAWIVALAAALTVMVAGGLGGILATS